MRQRAAAWALTVVCGLWAGCTAVATTPGPSGGCGAAGQSCCAGSSCNAGLSCAAGVCDAASSTGNGYATCQPGDACGASLSCQMALTTTTGGAATVCTATCSPMTACPPPSNGRAAVCFALSSGVGQCLAGCAADTDCAVGMRCATLPGSSTLGCLAVGEGPMPSCGASGQACCSGDACASGLACVSGRCAAVAQPYQSCANVGAACAGGTTCMQAQVRAPTTPVGNLCTASCASGLASECPGFVAGQVECVDLPGTMPRQCLRLCATATDCVPYGLQCLRVTTETGTMVQVCAP